MERYIDPESTIAPEDLLAWLERLASSLPPGEFHPAADVCWSIDQDRCQVNPVHAIRHYGGYSEWKAGVTVKKTPPDVATAIRTAIARSRLIDIIPQASTRGWKRRIGENYLACVWQDNGELVFQPTLRCWRNRKKKSMLGKPARDTRRTPVGASDEVLHEAVLWAVEFTRVNDLALF